MNQISLLLPIKGDWITAAFLLIFLLLVVAKYIYKERLLELTFVLFNKRYLINYRNEQGDFYNLFYILLFSVQILALSLLIYLTAHYIDVDNRIASIPFLFLKIIGVLICYFLIRHLIGMFLGQVFQLKKAQEKLAFVKISYLFSVSILILPFLIFAYYVNSYGLLAFRLLIVVLSILLIMRYVFTLKFNKSVVLGGLFYFILYLCALEIAPLLLIFKIIN
ncbi:DUF4271 domain-containing protein [Urechidicola vernalis]|uniref:DUF4271 domain-containing protein n=1 Tax=Urechidicola vernalis TaxID=3075600 RepID=A0ABU2Y9C5_9FLAO|nr:DUF4271 domain-containing protein [Urechidicola sp. P050]MDT0553663.1 DUF4271 domain-containing protein [Urechidicola sp. P050]